MGQVNEKRTASVEIFNALYIYTYARTYVHPRPRPLDQLVNFIAMVLECNQSYHLDLHLFYLPCVFQNTEPCVSFTESGAVPAK